ncbi:alcohol dehydrogenase [Actinomadura rupiterrae]|uniref:alcohol dehydrogenase n=1 Tax=Actinomadura rupiterrae TaxID=559627 RepID=UPI0020A61092|nr:alcohol dehydrogenase [Actinomadura rupiterrae]MCP2340723.1 propanol-preferring alcohol dehydrogenase [Actinomadura rupiterrae]
MSSTMRAVRAVAAGEPFQAVELAVPEPGRDQVRVKVHACGVCGGDAVARFDALGLGLPRTPGHEVAGVVDAVGDGVTAWRPGDRVGVGWHGGHCFVCRACRRGDFVNCDERKIVGASYDGGYAEYMVAPQAALAAVPDELTFGEAAPLMCAGLTTFNALRHSGARPGDTVAVQGIGGLGHLAVQYADKMGFRVVAVNRGRAKEDVARRLGADEYVDSEASGGAGAGLRKLGGARVVLSTAGSASAQADIATGLAPNGRMVVIANDHDPIPVPGDLLVFGRREVTGWYSGHAADSEDAMEFAVLTGVRPMIETRPLAEAEDAFQTMNKARFRTVLTI